MTVWNSDMILQKKITLVVLFAIMASFLLVYSESTNSIQAATKVSAEQLQIQSIESSYKKNVNSTISKINSVFDETEKLGLRTLTDDVPIQNTVNDLQLMETSLSEIPTLFDNDTIPRKYQTSHQQLIKGVDHLQQSVTLLKTSFEKFNTLENPRIPSFYISTLLGGDETQLTSIYMVLLINEKDQNKIEDARNLYVDSLSEASIMRDNLDDFFIQYDVNLNTTSHQRFEKSLTYFGSTLSCGCNLPLVFP